MSNEYALHRLNLLTAYALGMISQDDLKRSMVRLEDVLQAQAVAKAVEARLSNRRKDDLVETDGRECTSDSRLNGESGITLIELMVVLAIMGVLIAIAIPSFTRYQLRADAREMSWQVASTFRFARDRSIRESIPHMVMFGHPNSDPSAFARIIRDVDYSGDETPGLNEGRDVFIDLDPRVSVSWDFPTDERIGVMGVYFDTRGLPRDPWTPCAEPLGCVGPIGSGVGTYFVSWEGDERPNRPLTLTPLGQMSAH